MQADRNRPVVLVVDDDVDVRSSIASVLADHGYACATVENGRAALDYLTSAGPVPSLILLDLMMPVLDGWTLLRELRGRPALAGIPVVVISAGGARARRSIPAGVPFVEKPLDLDRLLAAVEQPRDDA